MIIRFKRGEETLAEKFGTIVPRMKETVKIYGREFFVTNVVYDFDDGVVYVMVNN